MDVSEMASTLIEHLPINRASGVGFVVCPYNGGDLVEEGLQLIEEFQMGVSERLECIALLRPPSLSEAEAAALSSLPAELREINVAQSELQAANLAVAATAAAAVAVVAHVAFRELGAARMVGQRDLIHLPDSLVSELGPEATAAELIRLRRTLLERA